MMANFKPILDKTLRFEGLYSRHPSDPGGETYRGISRRYHGTWDGWKIIDEYKTKSGFPNDLEQDEKLKSEVEDFYLKNFWNKIWGFKISSERVAAQLFDTAVNIGIHRAVKILQESLNALNRQEHIYPDIKSDGMFGSITLASLEAFLHSGNASYLTTAMKILRGCYYMNRIKQATGQEIFLRGWLNRLEMSEA